jgi:transcriptional regulator with XRE-family HTH domain
MKPQKIRDIRLNLNLTQSDFGKLLGYAPESANIRVSELENGKVRITHTIEILLRYIEKYGVLEG